MANFDLSRGTSNALPIVFAAGTIIVDGEVVSSEPALTVRQLVAQSPHRARVFEKYGISYCCCSENQTLAEACAAHQADPQKVLNDLAASDKGHANGQLAKPYNWSQSNPTELRQHLLTIHHPFLKSELSRISHLIDRVTTQHGAHYSELWELQGVFEEFKEEVEWHLERAENQFFPLLAQFEALDANKAKLRVEISREICTLELEHAYLSNTLQCLLAVVTAFRQPTAACNTFRVVFVAIEEMANDIQLHLEEERYLLSHWNSAQPSFLYPGDLP